MASAADPVASNDVRTTTGQVDHVERAGRTERLDRVELTIRERRVFDLGEPGSSIGDLTFTRGDLRATSGGRVIGSFTTRVSVVEPGDTTEKRDTLVTLRLPGGRLQLRQLTPDPTGKPPRASHRMPIVGGSGPYLGARGVGLLDPGAPGVLSLTMTYEPVEAATGMRPLTLRRTLTRTEDDEIGTYSSLTVSSTTLRGYTSQAGVRMPFLCSSTDSAASGIGASQIATWFCRYAMADGALLTSGVVERAAGTLPSGEMRHSIVGGTGAFAGARGQAVVDARAWGATSSSITFNLAMSGGTYTSVEVSEVRSTSSRWSARLAPGAGLRAEEASAPDGDAPSLGFSAWIADAREWVTAVSLPLEGGTVTGTTSMRIRPGQTAQRPYSITVNGGTGLLQGATGTLRVSPMDAGRERISGTLLTLRFPFD